MSDAGEQAPPPEGQSEASAVRMLCMSVNTLASTLESMTQNMRLMNAQAKVWQEVGSAWGDMLAAADSDRIPLAACAPGEQLSSAP